MELEDNLKQICLQTNCENKKQRGEFGVPKNDYRLFEIPGKLLDASTISECIWWLTAPTSFKAAVMEMAGMAGMEGLEEGVALETASWGVGSDCWVGGATGGGAPPAGPTLTFTPRATS